MGDFTKRVQSGEVAGPLQRKFTPKSWKSEFEAAGAPNDNDHFIYDAALVLHTKLQNIRSRLKLSSSTNLSATTKVRAFVAAANHNFLLTRTKTREALKKIGAEYTKQGSVGLRLEDMANEVKLNLSDGFEYSPDAIVQSLVDGIEVPTRFALQATPDLSGNPRMEQVEWTDIALELNLGILFRHAEDLWDDCLWNKYKLVDKENFKFFVPQDIDAKRGQSIGVARRQSLAMAHTVMSTKYHRIMMERGQVPRIREVRAIERQGKSQVIRVSKPGEFTSALEELLVMRGYANEPYYADLLDEPLPLYKGLTLSAVLDAWVVISGTVAILVESQAKKELTPANPDSPAHTWLPGFAPVLHVNALVQALLLASGIKPAEGKLLIEFFTFRGKDGQEIWAQPLLPVGLTTVAPVFAAGTSPNLRRLVDVWMRQGGIDLSKRGPAFEMHIRTSVFESIASSKVLSGHAASIKEDYTFKPTVDCKEQIDLIFMIGSTVFLAEAKCILEPTDAKGVAMHRKAVLGGAEQALRKSQALEDNRKTFVEDMKRLAIIIPQNFNVIPLVVVSTSTHVGVPANGVPVVDEYILTKFLEGELEDVAITGHDLEIQKVVKTIFYTNPAEAEAKAQNYFSSPPQVQRLVNGIVARLIPLHAIDKNDWEGFAVTLDCVPKNDGVTTVETSEPIDQND
jgi:hypothetical protein